MSPAKLPDPQQINPTYGDPVPAELRRHLFDPGGRTELPADEEWFGRELAELVAPVLETPHTAPADLDTAPPLAALASAVRGIVITDVHGSILWANAAFVAATGFPLNDARGRSPGSLVRSGEQDPAFYHGLWRTIQAGQVWRGVVRNRRRNGEPYAEDMIIAPVRTGGGAITHFIGVKAELGEFTG